VNLQLAEAPPKLNTRSAAAKDRFNSEFLRH